MKMKMKTIIITGIIASICFGSPAYSYGYKKLVSYKSLLDFDDNSIRIRRAWSKVVRKDGSMCMSINTRQLPEGSYTNWWLIYNNPENCASKTCGVPDLFNPSVNATLMFAAAGIVGPNKKSIFSGCVDEGELTHEVLIGTDGVADVKKADVQVVVRYHGPSKFDDPLGLGEQVSVEQGGCENAAQGIAGFPCFDVQITDVHKASKGYKFY